MRSRSIPLVLLVLTTCLGCGKKIASNDCEAMLDRYLDLSMAPTPEIARMPPKQAESVIAERKNDRRSDPSYAVARARCEREITRSQFECAIKAPTANDWEACLD